VILDVIKVPNEFLNSRSAEVEEVTDETRKILEDMAETMFAEGGIGLAAPQVGYGQRLVVVGFPVVDGLAIPSKSDELGPHLQKLVNPRIVSGTGTTTFNEACLSVPDIAIKVRRFKTVVIEAMDETGTPIRFQAEDLYSVCMQHEIDHLDGVTLLHKMPGPKRRGYLRRRKRVSGT